MKKQLLLLSVLLSAGWQVQSQNTFINEDFESYTVDGFVAVQSTVWNTWTMAPGSAEDASVSNEVANSGTNSMRISTTTHDMVLPIGPYTTGLYTIEFYMYMPAGNGGYFNVLHNWPIPYQWACQVYFHSDGSINWTAGGAPGQGGTFTPATWFKVLATIDMDTDVATMNINNVDLFTFQWSLDDSNGMAGLNQLAAVNFYGAAAVGSGAPFYYIDDVKVTDVNGVGVNEVNDTFAVTTFPNPANDVLNITTGSAAPVALTLFDIAGKTVVSKVINQSNYGLNVSALNEGIYLLRMVQGENTITKKVVVQR